MAIPKRHLRRSSFFLALKCLSARQERAATAGVQKPAEMLPSEDFAIFANAPLREQLADRLAAAMWAIEEAIAICEIEENASRDTSWIEPDLRDTYDQVNGLMKTITN
jgi:hypothetical protein